MALSDDIISGKYSNKSNRSVLNETIKKKKKKLYSDEITSTDIINNNYDTDWEAELNKLQATAMEQDKKWKAEVANSSSALGFGGGFSNASEVEETPWWKKILQVPEAFNDNLDRFKDGYQFGDITKTVGETLGDTVGTVAGTAADIGLGAIKGVAQTGEGIGTLLAGGVAQVADWAGNDKFADKVRKNIATKKPPVSTWLGEQQEKVDNFSIMGDIGDKTSEAIGYIGSIWATGGLGGSGAATATMFGSSAGGTLPESYKKEDVEDWQVWTKAIGTGAIETVTEKLFGLFGTTGLDKGVANAISNRISSGVGKILARTGIQATGEAVEEFLSYAGSQGLDFAIDEVNKHTGEDGATFKEDWNWEEVGEQMAIAFLASGALGAGSNISSITSNKTDTNTWGEAINETARQQDVQAQAEVLTSEIDKLQKQIKKSKDTAKVQELQTELNWKEKQLNALQSREIAPVDNTAQIQGLQESIATKQEELNNAQDPREQQIIQEEITNLNQELTEATNAQQFTNAPEKQHFTYKASENDSDIKKAVYESASKYFNDTKASHAYVDVVAKIAEDRQTIYEFANTEEIREAIKNEPNGENVDLSNVSVNGFVTSDGRVLINVDSKQGLDFILGHETTHLLEGTAEYKALHDIVIEYAKKKGIYEDRVAKLHSLYKGKNANIENELTSDLVGELLFTDQAFIENLSIKQPTLFEKIKNFISDLIVKVKGTAQEKELRKIQRSFEKAYRAKGTQTSTQANTKYSLSDNQGRELSKEQQEFFKDSKARDENGNLETVYHGTNKAGFTEFSGGFRGVNYYTSNENVAKSYFTTTSDSNGIYEGYVNITKPLEIDVQSRKWSEIRRDFISDTDILKLIDDNFGRKYNIFSTTDIVIAAKKSGKYDGVIFKNIYDNAASTKKDLSTVYATFNSNQFKNVDNTNPTANPDIRYSLSEETDIDAKINSSMTMAEAKSMIERAFIANDIKNWYDGQYKTGTEWLEDVGVDEVGMYIENTYELQSKYINTNSDILNEEYTIYDVLQAYLDGTLTGKVQETSKRLDLSKDTGYKDDRFYAPKEYSNDLKLYEVANQRVTKANRSEVYKARADFIINAHNKGYAESIGLTQQEVNKKLKSWANYPRRAMELSNSINEGVATQNRWAGIENSSIVNTISVSNEQMEKLVKKVEGDSNGWQRQYITSTMLALDTHIDYSNLTIKFDQHAALRERHAAGDYDYTTDTIRIGDGYQNTVAHEMGHYIDHLWAKELNLGRQLTDRHYLFDTAQARLTEEQKTFAKNFDNFLHSIENSSDIGSTYKMSSNEVFARFIGRFTEWTKNQATNNRYGYENKWYKDNFTESQYIEFARLLQEKSMLDAMNKDFMDDLRAKVDAISGKHSLSAKDDEAPIGNVFGADLKYQVEEAIAPLQENIVALTEQVQAITNQFENIAPTSQEVVEQQAQENMANVTDNDAPRSFEDIAEEAMWNEEFESDSTSNTVESPFDSRDIDEVGNRKIKAYQYENPEVRPFFQTEAENMMYDLDNTIKGERSFNDQLYYDSNGEQGFYGTTRQTTEAIAYLKDKYGYSYDQIRKGLNDIIEDNGQENNAVAKRIEFMLDERLRNGYTTSDGIPIPANEEYIKFLEERQITEYNREVSSTLTDRDVPEIAPEARETATEPRQSVSGQFELRLDDDIAQEGKVAQNQNTELSDTSEETQEQEKIAQILSEAPTPQNKKQRLWAKTRAAILDKGSVFEDISLKTKNRNLMAKWDYILTAEARAQNVMMDGTYEYDATNKERRQVSKSLNDIRTEVGDRVQEFSEYLYHKHNISRMSLESNAQARMAELQETTLKGKDIDEIARLSRKRIPAKIDKKTNSEQLALELQIQENLINDAKEYMRLSEAKNKPVFGESVTAEVSQKIAEEFENNNPEFMDWAKDVYDYNNANLSQLVKNGVISQETADKFAEMYPYYVPIGRNRTQGNAINVPLDTNRTGINTPIRRATGGSTDILPLFDTMAKRTVQTYKAIAKNSFGVELKNSLNSVVDNQATSTDEILDNVDQQEDLLQEGKNGQAPTFTVFENGEKVTYEITQDMYEALKPVSESSLLSTTFKPFNAISNFHRGVLTEYNPVFMLTNGIKDSQDILLNSQHPAKTYAKLPEAYTQLLRKGYWYQEYMANGGEQNSYFDSQEGTFDTEKKGVAKVLDLPPLKQISQLNTFIELAPRLAEYIASREAGRSVETSMLDAARVTTNFKAGGDVTKWANRNGATFLNASIQGAMQQVRNVREAHANGLKGYANLAAKFTLASLPAMILNGLLWGDDEEYEELSDYVKQSYYIVGKYGDGNFIRIPKGRMITVVQEGLNQMANLVTGNGEADLGQFLEIVGNNIAPNNPVESNVLSPIIQAATNTTWYGDDLVPTRLQDEPVEEQFDESTDKLSIFLGQALGISPYKINYVIDQYSGGIGDVFLPMMTQEAETGTDSMGEKLIAPLTNKFTVDSTMKNQNVSDLYTLSEELTSKANSTSAKDEDILKNKYLNSIKSEMNELYKQKREIQSSNISDSEKYNQVREIQKQINSMAREALDSYEDINKTSNYASVGDKEYYLKNDTWTKVDSDELADLNGLNMNLRDKSTYFTLKSQISKIKASDTENKKKEIATVVKDTNLTDEQKAYIYGKNYSSDETLDLVLNSGISFNSYLDYASQEFVADKDSEGKSISGSRRKKVISYVNSLSLNIPQKAMLIRTEYSTFDTYNKEIVRYVGSLDLDYADKVKMLESLDLKVSSDGTVSW